MPAERVTMRKIKDLLRLKWACGLSNRQVAASCGVARSTVAETLDRATAAGLSWPLPEDLDDAQLEARLYPAAPSPMSPPRAMPDWATVHQELTRKGMTLALLSSDISVDVCPLRTCSTDLARFHTTLSRSHVPGVVHSRQRRSQTRVGERPSSRAGVARATGQSTGQGVGARQRGGHDLQPSCRGTRPRRARALGGGPAHRPEPVCDRDAGGAIKPLHQAGSPASREGRWADPPHEERPRAGWLRSPHHGPCAQENGDNPACPAVAISDVGSWQSTIRSRPVHRRVRGEGLLCCPS